MRIGVDFDNTIICYDSVFYKVAREQRLIPEGISVDKQAVRDYLRQIDCEDDWTRLQGYVYGKRILAAEPFPGFFDFLYFCRQHRHSVFVISHKTKHPYLGPQFDLHDAGFRWLQTKGILDLQETGLSGERVFFEESKAAKLNRIALQKCTHFIDDLPEFLCEIDFPPGVQKILFDPNRNHEGLPKIKTAASWKEALDILKKMESGLN